MHGRARDGENKGCYDKMLKSETIISSSIVELAGSGWRYLVKRCHIEMAIAYDVTEVWSQSSSAFFTVHQQR